MLSQPKAARSKRRSKPVSEGLTRFIGITGHGVDAPAIYLEALRRFDFDSILFPLNFVQMANPKYRSDAEALIAECRRKDVGTMAIKTVTKGPWKDDPHWAACWYEPFNEMETIQKGGKFRPFARCDGIVHGRRYPCSAESVGGVREIHPAF